MKAYSACKYMIGNRGSWLKATVGILTCMLAFGRLGTALEPSLVVPTEFSALPYAARALPPIETSHDSFATEAELRGGPAALAGRRPTPELVSTATQILQPRQHVSHIHVASAYLDRIVGAEVNIVGSSMQPVQGLGVTDASGRVPVRLRMDEEGNLEGVGTGSGKEIIIEVTFDGYISRHARLSWSNAQQFEEGFAVSLWRESDLNNLDYIVVNNPHEYAVVLACDSGPNSTPMVMAKGIDEDAVRLRQFARCACPVTAPELARALFVDVPVGLRVPQEFTADVRRLCQSCREGRRSPEELDFGVPISDDDLLVPDAVVPEVAGNTWHTHGQFLYLRPGSAKVAYAAAFNAPILPVPVGPVGAVNPDYEPGFRAGFGLMLDPISELQVSYTFMESGTSDAISVTNPLVIQSLVAHPAIAANPFLSAEATLDVDFDLIDVEFRRTFFSGELFAMDYLLGARYASLRQQFASGFSGFGTQIVNTDIDFDGGGIRLGLETDTFAFYNQFHLFANGYASFMGGRFRGDFLQSQSFDPLVVSTELEERRVVPILDLELGVGWTSCSGRLSLMAGYQVSAWFNTLTTKELIRGVQRNDFAGLSETITFDGLQARLEYRF